MYGFCNVWVCKYVGFVMCCCVYLWVFNVCICEFCNELLCVCMGLVICDVCVSFVIYIFVYVWDL